MVIPFYNVERYFAECLTSVVRQGYRNLQIILVDDGSSDRSLSIARGYARWDRRITIIRQPNKGLGGARNTGIAAATGYYLCFVDSDDTLPRDSISRMVRTQEQTGSDFVVGAVCRIPSKRREVPGWVKQVHARDRLGVQLDDFPDILRNVFAWSKLFVRISSTTWSTVFPRASGTRTRSRRPAPTRTAPSTSCAASCTTGAGARTARR